jgi:hypothetical protein
MRAAAPEEDTSAGSLTLGPSMIFFKGEAGGAAFWGEVPRLWGERGRGEPPSPPPPLPLLLLLLAPSAPALLAAVANALALRVRSSSTGEGG